MSIVHTYPLDDLIEHDIEHFDACICCPEVELVSALDNGWLVVHNSFDGREQHESEA